MPNTDKNTPMPQCDKKAVSGSYFMVHWNTAHGTYYFNEKGFQTQDINKAKRY